MNKISSIRCPNTRRHKQYELCNHLLGAVENKRMFLYCEMCHQFFEVIVKDNDNLEMIPLPKDKLKLNSILRMVE